MNTAKHRTIDLTPSWQQAARILIECIKHGASESAKAEAEAELIRMARLLDERRNVSRVVCNNNISLLKNQAE